MLAFSGKRFRYAPIIVIRLLLKFSKKAACWNNRNSGANAQTDKMFREAVA